MIPLRVKPLRDSDRSLSEVYKLSPHDQFSQKTLEKLNAENKLFSVQKYNKSTLDIDMDYYGYIDKENIKNNSISPTSSRTSSTPSILTQNLLPPLILTYQQKMQELEKQKEVKWKSKVEELFKQMEAQSKKRVEQLTKELEKRDVEIEDLKKRNVEFTKELNKREDKFTKELNKREDKFARSNKKMEDRVTNLEDCVMKQNKKLEELTHDQSVVVKVNLLKEGFKYLATKIIEPHLTEIAISPYLKNETPEWISMLDCYVDSTLVIAGVPISTIDLKELWTAYDKLRKERNDICHRTESDHVQLQYNECEHKFITWYKICIGDKTNCSEQ